MPDYITTPAIVPTVQTGMETIPNGAETLNNSTAMFLGLGVMGLIAFIIILSILAMVLWIWSIVHIAKNENFTDDNQKIIWLLIVVFTGIIGSVVYFFAKPSPKNK